jgi:Cu+-exporting ATPase
MTVENRRASHSGNPTSAVLHVDPVCDMRVDPATAAAPAVHQGQTYYFCNTHCLERFKADPERYVKFAPSKPPQPPPHAGGTYTCPMHPEVRQDRPGACPKCGMALEPVSAAPPVTKVEYTCPMHPQIVRDAPGNCPVARSETAPRSFRFALDLGPLTDSAAGASPDGFPVFHMSASVSFLAPVGW